MARQYRHIGDTVHTVFEDSETVYDTVCRRRSCKLFLADLEGSAHWEKPSVIWYCTVKSCTVLSASYVRILPLCTVHYRLCIRSALLKLSS